jgi:hypothetical protein
MKQAKEVLERLTFLLPPPDGKHHSITFDEVKDALVVSVWVNGLCAVPCYLEDHELKDRHIVRELIRVAKEAVSAGQ